MLQVKLQTVMGGLPTIGAMNPDAHISDELWSTAWQHELSILTRQMGPILEEVDGNQLLNLFLFWGATIGYQIMRQAAAEPDNKTAQHQAALMKRMVEAAQVYAQLHDEAGTFSQNEAGQYVLLLPDVLTPVQIDMLQKALPTAKSSIVV